MRLRIKCKCGAELEARGSATDVGVRFKDFWAVHSFVCMAVDSIDHKDGRALLGLREQQQRKPA